MDRLLEISKEIDQMSAFIEQCSMEVIQMQTFQSDILTERLKGCKKWTKALAVHLARRTKIHGTVGVDLQDLRQKTKLQANILLRTEETMQEEQEEFFFSRKNGNP